MKSFNEQLASNALKRIKETPWEWEQETWRCASGMCFAGFVAMEARAKWASTSDHDDTNVITPDGDFMDVQEFAAQELGVYHDNSSWEFFTPTNTIESLEAKIAARASRDQQPQP